MLLPPPPPLALAPPPLDAPPCVGLMDGRADGADTFLRAGAAFFLGATVEVDEAVASDSDTS